MGKYLLVFALSLALFLAVPAWAQSDEPAAVDDSDAASEALVTGGDVAVEAVAVADVQPLAEEPELEGVELEQPTEVPSAFGLWWKGVKEKVSIGLTFNPVKKAEKQLQFAEERMRLAELMAQKAEDQKTQARIHRVIGQAQEMMEKVEARRDRLLQQNDERARRLLRNVATHQVRREVVMDKIEEKLPDEAVEKWEELRERAASQERRLLNAISNENVPAEVREHLEAVKNRIEAHAEEVRQYRERRLKLMEEFKAGDEAARERIKELQQNRVEALRERRLEFEKNKIEDRRERRLEVKQEIKQEELGNKLEKIKNGEAVKPLPANKPSAVIKLKELKQELKQPAPVGGAIDQTVGSQL
ncbi:MAG: hypothetical protein HY980_04220 [Candidatus Magasanikbacteria bacterium]|nr:hypothetical protein [Candidatus Magasanikbacteria bacterium]